MKQPNKKPFVARYRKFVTVRKLFSWQLTSYWDQCDTETKYTHTHKLT